MNLFPLTPALKRRGAIVLGAGLLTGLAVGGVAVNAVAANTPAATTPATEVANSVAGALSAPAGRAVRSGVGSAPADLPQCSSLVAAREDVRVTPLRKAKALPAKPMRAKEKSTSKVGSGESIDLVKVGSGFAVAKATPVRIQGKTVKAVAAIPACVVTTKDH